MTNMYCALLCVLRVYCVSLSIVELHCAYACAEKIYCAASVSQTCSVHYLALFIAKIYCIILRTSEL